MHFIPHQRANHPIVELCTALHIPRSAYYRWAKEPAAASEVASTTATPPQRRRRRRRRRQEITRLTLQLFGRHERRYGTRRLVPELADLGYAVGRDQVRAIYREFGPHAIQPKSFVPKTTQAHPNRRRSPNLLLEAPPPPRPDVVWVGDITYLPLQDGSFCYLASFQDSCSRTIVGYAVADHLREALTLTALERAVKRRHPAPGLIIHTDGGGQYSSIAFRGRLTQLGYRSSMTRRDNHYDNAQAESFFSRFKAELLPGGRRFATLAEAESECFSYIEGYYNTVRRHSSLGFRSPLNFEKQFSG